MKRKVSKSTAILVAASSLACTAGAATLSINGASAPSTNIITANAGNGSGTTVFSNHATIGKITRGQSFATPTAGAGSSAFSVSALTIQKNGAQTYGAGDTLQLWIFAWNPSADGNDFTNWGAGDGLADGDLYDGTGATNILTSSFDINTLAFTANGYITFDLSADSILLDESTSYGFLIGYQDGNTAANSGLTFTIKERANGNPDYTDGAQIRTHGADHLNFSRDTTFFLQGTAVPEPSSAVLFGLSSLGLLLRRRK